MAPGSTLASLLLGVIEWLILDRDQHPFTKTDLSDLTQLFDPLCDKQVVLADRPISVSTGSVFHHLLSNCEPFHQHLNFLCPNYTNYNYSNPSQTWDQPINSNHSTVIMSKPSKKDSIMVSKNHPWNIPLGIIKWRRPDEGDRSWSCSSSLTLSGCHRLASLEEAMGGFQCKRWVLKWNVVSMWYIDVYCTLSWDNHDGIYSIYVISISSIWYTLGI